MIVWALLLSHRNWTRKMSIADGVVSGADPALVRSHGVSRRTHRCRSVRHRQ